MLYKALKSFVGLEKMRRGEIKEIKNEAIVKDLLNAGYIEAVKGDKKAEPVKVEPETDEAKPEIVADKPKKGGRPKKTET